ncbi:MAG: response regulator [Candidatus Omnitrophica bacterium]|nr:response regulator [Candidatus Omnitrophota bacterium]
MNKKTIVQTIFLWFEIIIAVRILLFAIPVMMFYLSHPALQGLIRHPEVTILCLLAILYLSAGWIGLRGHPTTKFFHLAVALVTLIIALMMKILESQMGLRTEPLPRTLSVLALQHLLRRRSRRMSKSILVVDDDQGLIKILEKSLGAKGYTVLSAVTGEGGLHIAQNKPVDLILLDVILPKIKGREVCARLKENKKTKDIPIIFLTAKNSSDDIKAELAAGAVSHITKPFSLTELISQVSKVLPKTI